MNDYELFRALREPPPALEELRVGRAYVLLELAGDHSVAFAEVILREVRMDLQAIAVTAFVIHSTNHETLPAGKAIVRTASRTTAGVRRSWHLAPI
jgi:hypothetical protein